ncbi:MAG: hypothetical protein F6K50_01760 [Moorea sp. SIO3I7]|uniref:hypothetical protein n=1 Tax=Moorena sp. SIO3I8 TaxID=2607833 RepID=UPI0013BFAAD7|nr:hypothetical protein [Moorena sp. SIO3I8]NEN94303.1 hypothetical protein [Moorena sp. SIO3I7]NEO06001.1 hypothetical protein [Moorena sp. SIO3I8]
MTNLLKQFTSTFKAQNNTQQNRDKTTVVTTPTTDKNGESPVVRQFSIRGIAFLVISVSIIFILGPHMIAKSMFKGQYINKLEISVEGITITTEIDTRESSAANDNTEEEETEETSQLSSSPR